MTAITIHKQAYEYYSWETLGTDIFELAKKIIESGQEFDRVVALAKGGLTFARSLVDFLAIEQLSSFQVELYEGIANANAVPVITQNLPISIRNERILLFDDLVDEGKTMQTALNYLEQQGAKSLTTATLLRKPWTKMSPDFWVRETEAWIIFPNEVRETIQNLVSMWTKAGDSQQKITEQLLSLGFTEPEVALFANQK